MSDTLCNIVCEGGGIRGVGLVGGLALLSGRGYRFQDAGRQAAADVLAPWSHAGYRAAYAAGRAPSARASAACMRATTVARREGAPA